MKLHTLLTGIVPSVTDLPDIEITRVTDRHEQIDGKTCFVLTRGVYKDKGYGIELARERRPAILICEEEADVDFPMLRVENARQTLSYLLFRFYEIDLSHTRLIGVTGTNGKTTTATMLSSILMWDGERVGMIGTGKIMLDKKDITPKGYTMTTPDPTSLYPILRDMIREKCHYVIMEVSSHALALSKVAPLPFYLSVFTGLGEDHMDFHKSREEYLAAKRQLLLQSHIAIVNADDAAAKSMLRCAEESLAVGALYGQDACITDIEEGGIDGITFLYRYGSALQRFSLSMGGIHNVTNAALAITAATRLGVRLCVTKEAVERVTVRGRMEKILDTPIVIIDYAHTAEAMKTVLKTARSNLNLGQKLYCLFGCGGERDRSKRHTMAAIAESYADLCVVTEDNSRMEDPDAIFRDILSGFTSDRHLIIRDRERAIHYLVDLATSEDVILLFGKGHETYLCRGAETIDFDERKIVREAYKMKKEGHTKAYED